MGHCDGCLVDEDELDGLMCKDCGPKGITPEEQAVLEAAEKWFKYRNEPPDLIDPQSATYSYLGYRDAGYDLNDAVAKMLLARGDGET